MGSVSALKGIRHLPARVLGPSKLADSEPATVRTVRLRGVAVGLDYEGGQPFTADCAHRAERLLPDDDICGRLSSTLRRRRATGWGQ